MTRYRGGVWYANGRLTAKRAYCRKCQDIRERIVSDEMGFLDVIFDVEMLISHSG